MNGYYQDSHSLGSSVPQIAGLPYLINRIWDDSSTGFYALGLSAPNAPSVLIFRGTGDKLDIWDDLNPNGIGFGQFTATYNGIRTYESIRQWLRAQDSTYAPIITGHSLGGSLAQWAAADATGNGAIQLGEVVTFNSPGISPGQTFAANQFGANVFIPVLAGDVTHYITSSDLVSLGGTKYLPGSYRLFDYSSLLDPVVGPHLNPVLVPSLPISGKTRPAGGDPAEKPFWFLNSPLYGYNTDIDFIVLRLAIAGVAKVAAAIPGIGAIVSSIINSVNKALRSRFDTEKLRTSLGEVLYLPGVRDALENAMSFASVAFEAASERVQSAFSTLVSGGREALDAIASLPADVWDEIANVTSTTWNALSSWTDNAWRDSVNWTISTWQTIISPAFTFAKPFITTAAKRLFFLPASVPMLPFAAASLEPSGDADALNGAGLFSMAAFSAPASYPSYQTIEVPIALSQPSTEVITLNFETVDGTAIGGVDYISRSGSLQFEPGETEKIVSIELLAPDSLPAEKEFKVRISNLQNAQFLTSEDISVVFKPNVAPVVALPPADQFAPIEEPLFFALPPDTFSDGNSPDGDLLQFSALLADGSPLPGWLSFDPATQTFSGTPPEGALGVLNIEVMATDANQSTATASFSLNVVAYDGPAAFSITGTPAVGQVLTAVRSADDPDGNGTDPTYIWQASSDGSIWSTIGADAPTHTVSVSDAGKQLRVQVAYVDGEGFAESAITAAVLIPLPNSAPSALNLSATSVNENAASGSAVATLTTTDPDAGNTFTYSLVSGLGDTDNNAFLISDNELLIIASPDFATKRTYTLRLRTTDQGGLSFERAVDLFVNPIGFDAFSYLAGYPDLMAAFGSDGAAATRHYAANGFGEGRLPDVFDESSYLASYPDLITAFGTDGAAATRHYVTNGFGEGRLPDAFDEFSYLASYPDLSAAFVTDGFAATRHFVEYGFSEGRMFAAQMNTL